MMMKQIADIIEKICPIQIQESWDNSGFQIMLESVAVNSVLVSLEVTGEVVDEAISVGADLIVTHHPLIFGSIKNICDNDITGNYIVKLIQNNIGVYSSHTPFDKCKGGNNDCIAGLLSLCDIKTSEADESGFLREGIVDGECTIREYIEHVAERLKIDTNMMSFAGDIDEEVKKVCLCTGAGADFLEVAFEAGCDLFITGDVKYHTARLARELNINILDIGHYGSEKIFVSNMAEYLRKNTDLKIIESKLDLNPFVAL